VFRKAGDPIVVRVHVVGSGNIGPGLAGSQTGKNLLPLNVGPDTSLDTSLGR
jgi:hypothetical protein